MEKKVLTDNMEKLVSGWVDLRLDLQNKGKLDYDLFEKLFTGTYELLNQHRSAPSVDKKYMKLIINAYNFAASKVAIANYMPQAAAVLTERMLHYCVLSEQASSAPDDSVYVYDLENLQEIRIDFRDVSKSLNNLVKYLEMSYWKKNG